MDNQKEEKYIKFMDGDTTHDYKEQMKPIINSFFENRTENVDFFDIENLARLIQRELTIQKYRVIEIEPNERYDIYFYHDNAMYFILVGLSSQDEEVELNIYYLSDTTNEFEIMLNELQNKIRAQQTLYNFLN